MRPRIRIKLADVGVALVAVVAGAAVVHFGDKLLGVRLELYFGIETFSPVWALDLFFVPFIAGILVSLIYGLGGKILAHFSPILVRIISFYELESNVVLPDGISVLPLGFWLLLVVVAAEFASIGGVVGEIIVKKTYGRTANRALLHKKYIKKDGLQDAKAEAVAAEKASVGGAEQ